jgi:predicted Zn-dependent protease
VNDRLATTDDVQALLDLGRPDEAVTVALRLVADDPDDASHRVLAAIALIGAGRPKEALEHSGKAVALAPDLAGAHAEHGRALAACRKLPAAADELRTAVDLAPADPYSHALLAEVLVQQARGPSRTMELLAEMSRHIEAVSELRPTSPTGPLLRAKASLAADRPADARRHAREALALDPDNVVGHQLLGLAAQREGEAAAASEHFLSAAKVDRSDHSFKLLERVKDSPQLGLGFGIFLFFALRIALATFKASDNVVAAIALVGGLLVAAIVVTRVRTRRAHSAEAREALRRHRQLRRGIRRL